MYKLIVLSLLLLETCNCFLPSIFTLENRIKLFTKTEDNVQKLNNLCTEINGYRDKFSYTNEKLSGAWKVINTKEEFVTIHSYQLFDYNNKSSRDFVKYSNGTMIENKYSIESLTGDVIIFSGEERIITFMNGTRVINNIDDNFERQLFYSSPSLRIDRKTDGNFIIFEPTCSFDFKVDDVQHIEFDTSALN